MTKKSREVYYKNKFKHWDYSKKAVFLSSHEDHYHQQIIRIIKKETEVKGKLNILDVGCATGYLGNAVKFGKNYVCGIEISENAAKEAEKVLDKVIVGDVEEIKLPFPEHFFDVIICSDIIEHLFDPKQVLCNLRHYLKPHGLLLMVVPNVAWYKIRLMILMGKWEYQNYGILDYGHIRWFTKESGRRLLEECGYTVENVSPYIVLPKLLTIGDHILRGYLKRLVSRFFDTIFAQGHLYVARGEK